MSAGDPRPRAHRLHEAAWPDMFSNLQTAYAELAQAQFQLQERTTEIEQTRDLFQQVIVSMSEALFLMDETGRIITTNPAAAALLGRPEDELTGQPFAAVVGTEVIPATPWRLLRTAPAGTLTNLNVTLPRPGGESLAVNASCTVVRDTRGKVIGVLVIARDVSLQRRAERERAELLRREQAARRQAEEANRAKDLFLATLSHELRTPLTPMLGWVLMLRSGQLGSEDAHRALDAIERNMRLQTQLIEDLLDVSRIITGKLTLSTGPVHLPAVVEAALETVTAAAQAKGIRIERAFTPVPAAVIGDAQRLQQIAWNLVSNAVKFTPRSGVVWVSVAPVGEHVELAVSDTGVGIDPAFLPYVFDRFRQADASTTRAYGGLGLGLAIVRHLAELHGGTVEAESPGPGRGATFRVRLPLVSAAGPERREEGAPPGAGRETGEPAPLAGVRILVAEDGADDRALLEVVLNRAGGSVICAESVAAAIAAFDRERPDVILSDISMPGEDGYALLRQVRAREGAGGVVTPAIALSALTSAHDRHRAVEAGFQRHLGKPFSPDTLVGAIVDLVRPRVPGG